MTRRVTRARVRAGVVAVLATTLCVPSLSQAQSVGPAAPEIVFVIPGDTASAMRAVTTAIHAAGFSMTARSTGFVTTDRQSLPGCMGYTPLVRISASTFAAGNGMAVVTLWGAMQYSSASAEEYVVYDHSQVPTGGCAWAALNGIRTAIIASTTHLTVPTAR